MRIFEVIKSSTNLSVPGSRAWYRNLYEPLVEMGHDVVLFPAEEGRRAMQRRDAVARATFSQKLLGTFRSEHARKPFDLFFAYLMDGMVEPGVIDEIRKTGVPTCNFSCNNTHQFYLVGELSPHFDYNLHSEQDAREKFLEIGANPVWWPMAAGSGYMLTDSTPNGILFSKTNQEECHYDPDCNHASLHKVQQHQHCQERYRLQRRSEVSLPGL
jgi:spore maturation protein CgeB